MRVKTALFCSLSTSVDFQTWLYNFDDSLYKSFMTDLREAKGCEQNKNIMMQILNKIEALQGGSQLESFLLDKYPHIVDAPGEVIANDKHQVFDDYVPGVLTYPRREIIKNHGDLDRQIQRFLASKIAGDYIIVDGVAYVEYLLPGEEELLSQIPTTKWKVKEYRARKDKS